MRYVGPVLNASGRVEPNPDCLVLDMRSPPYKVRRCEFKFAPVGAADFSHNGTFDVAIIWELLASIDRSALKQELQSQNHCQELIVLSEFQAFRNLPEYDVNIIERITGLQDLRDAVLHRDRKFPMVYALAIAARLSPQMFRIDKLTALLAERFPEVRRASPQGRTNYVLAFAQTQPPFLEHMHGRFYRWIPTIDGQAARAQLEQIITERFLKIPPSDSDVHRFSE
jgi:hypothetical protein